MPAGSEWPLQVPIVGQVVSAQFPPSVAPGAAMRGPRSQPGCCSHLYNAGWGVLLSPCENSGCPRPTPRGVCQNQALGRDLAAGFSGPPHPVAQVPGVVQGSTQRLDAVLQESPGGLWLEHEDVREHPEILGTVEGSLVSFGTLSSCPHSALVGPRRQTAPGCPCGCVPGLPTSHPHLQFRPSGPQDLPVPTGQQSQLLLAPTPGQGLTILHPHPLSSYEGLSRTSISLCCSPVKKASGSSSPSTAALPAR